MSLPSARSLESCVLYKAAQVLYTVLFTLYIKYNHTPSHGLNVPPAAQWHTLTLSRNTHARYFMTTCPRLFPAAVAATRHWP